MADRFLNGSKYIFGLFRTPTLNQVRGFTLIELLIVIAIILILIAIALPNFLEAQVRAKIAKAKGEMRTLGIAMDSYFLDWKMYPPDNDPNDFGQNGFNQLTSPIAYITSIPQEHFIANIYPLGNKVLFKILNDPASIYYVMLFNPETREIEKQTNSDFNLLASYNGKFLITENDGKTLKIVDESLNEIKLFDKQSYSPKYSNLQFQDNQLVVFTEESSIKGQEMAIVNMDKEIIQHFDIYPGYKNSNPRNFSVINNELYFTAYSKNLGYQLWKLGIDEILSTENPKAEVVKNTLHFYPNPALDRIQFDDEIDIKVYDLNGRMVLNHNACESLDVSTLPAGMYILISSNGIGKLLKE